MKRVLAFFGVWLALLFVAILPGCTGAQRRADDTAIVTTGGVVHGLIDANEAAYTHATDTMFAAQPDTAARAAAVEPLDRVYRERSRAIQGLTAILYTTAHANMASAQGMTNQERLTQIEQALPELQTVLRVLRDGSVLPAIPIPQQLLDAEAALIAFTNSGAPQ